MTKKLPGCFVGNDLNKSCSRESQSIVSLNLKVNLTSMSTFAASLERLVLVENTPKGGCLFL